MSLKLFTIGYGGRKPANVVEILREEGVRAVVDTRLRPDRASMGVWVKAKSAEKGIEKWLNDAGIVYRSLPELGNLFLDFDDWPTRYARFFELAGELLVERLEEIPRPYCLLCAEKRVEECHRRVIAEYLEREQNAEVVHLI